MATTKIFKTTSPEYLAIALQKQQAIAKANEEKLTAFKETAVAQRDAVRKVRLQQYMTNEQATAMLKSLSDISDTDFTIIISGFAANEIKPVVKATEEVIESIDYTRAILEAKYGKK